MVPGREEKMKAPASAAARLRLCRLRLWSNFHGFGFVLTAETTRRRGLYVGDVEDQSPAKTGGLQAGDRIVEVEQCCPFVRKQKRSSSYSDAATNTERNGKHRQTTENK